MKQFLLLFSILSFLSCNKKEERLENKLSHLETQNQLLLSQLDSLQNSPAIKFEELLRQDVMADSLRRSNVNEFIPYSKLSKTRTQDSVLIENYIDFAKNNKESYFSTYAVDRIQDIKSKRRQIKINDLVGSWQWESITNLMFPFKGKRNEKIVFNKEGKVSFYRNNKLISEEKYKIQNFRMTPNPSHIKFYKRGTYAISLKKNNILTLTKGAGICIDCGTNIYRKH